MMDFQQHTATNLCTFQKHGLLCDLTLVSVDGVSVYTHAVVMAAASRHITILLMTSSPGVYTIHTPLTATDIHKLVKMACSGQVIDDNHWKGNCYNSNPTTETSLVLPRCDKGVEKADVCCMDMNTSDKVLFVDPDTEEQLDTNFADHVDMEEKNKTKLSNCVAGLINDPGPIKRHKYCLAISRV